MAKLIPIYPGLLIYSYLDGNCVVLAYSYPIELDNSSYYMTNMLVKLARYPLVPGELTFNTVTSYLSKDGCGCTVPESYYAT